MSSQISSTRPRNVMLFTTPRSASNLLLKMLSEQKNFDSTQYNFLEATLSLNYMMDEGVKLGYKPELVEDVYKQYQEGYDEYVRVMKESAEAGRPILAKEHVLMQLDPKPLIEVNYPGQTGPSLHVHAAEATEPETYSTDLCVPDEFLLQWQPVFTVRHPALMFPSLARATKDTGRVPGAPHNNAVMNLVRTRKLAEWYTARGMPPVIMEADEIINNPEVVRELCRKTGMDPEAVLLQWSVNKEESSAVVARFKSSIFSSTGVIKGKSSDGLNIVAEREKWISEFGPEYGAKLAELVDEAMPDYEWFREQRLRC